MHFKHFGGLVVDKQKLAQEPHFKHVGDLAHDIGKSLLKTCIFSILGAWPWVMDKSASSVEF